MRRASVLLGFLMLACAPAPGSRSAGPAPEARAAISQMPEGIGAFRLTEAGRFPDPAAGAFYRYRDDSALEPDVYLYPLSQTAREGGDSPRERAKAEGALFPVALEISRERGRFDHFEVKADSAVSAAWDNGAAVGWHTAAELFRRGEIRSDHQYIFALGDQLLKVRITYAPGAVGDEVREQFIQDLLQALASPPA